MAPTRKKNKNELQINSRIFANDAANTTLNKKYKIKINPNTVNPVFLLIKDVYQRPTSQILPIFLLPKIFDSDSRSNSRSLSGRSSKAAGAGKSILIKVSLRDKGSAEHERVWVSAKEKRTERQGKVRERLRL